MEQMYLPEKSCIYRLEGRSGSGIWDLACVMASGFMLQGKGLSPEIVACTEPQWLAACSLRLEPIPKSHISYLRSFSL